MMVVVVGCLAAKISSRGNQNFINYNNNKPETRRANNCTETTATKQEHIYTTLLA
jgi:hypothetical protein